VKKLAIVAAAGVLLVVVGAVLVILLYTEPRATSTGGPSQPEVASPPPPPTIPAPLPAPPPGSLAPGPAIQVARPGWEQARQLQLPDAVVRRELSPPLAPCFERVRDGRGGAPVMRLLFEAIPGGLRVVDTEPVSRDPGNEALVSCAEQVLRDRKVSMEGFAPGERLEASYALADPEQARGDRRQDRGNNPSSPQRTFQRQRGKGPGYVAP